MMPDGATSDIVFCDDAALGYERSRTPFPDGTALLLDEAYRLAHLPLVAPGHPGIIARREGTDYEFGRHARIFSLVLPVGGAALQLSPCFQPPEQALRDSCLSRKIAWDLLPRRAGRLHATIVGSLGTGQAPLITAQQRCSLAAIGPFQVQIRGLFSGTVNRGRLYLRVYPQLRDGRNPFHAVQAAMGRASTDLYLVGLYNLIDDLDPVETAVLAELIARFWQTPLLTCQADALWLMGACDDLVLDADIAETLPLHPGPAGEAPPARA